MAGDFLRNGCIGSIVHMTAGVKNEAGDGGIGGRREHDKISFVLNGDVCVRFQRSQGFTGGSEGSQSPGDKPDNTEDYYDASDDESTL